MIKIIKPSIGGHDGSSFRELLDMWEERGFCTVEMGPTTRSSGYMEDPDSPEAKCWIEEQGNILLYDFPILDRLKNEYKECLFANTYEEGEKNKKWIFWPRYSRLYEKSKSNLRNIEKTHKCCFIGTPTNLERNKIAQYWSQICDVWNFRGGLSYKSYLEICARCSFGLCLPGVGPKCLRDIEYMGLGTIPIVVNKAAMDLYHSPPVENEHYLFAEDAADCLSKMDKLLANPKKTKEMSQACIEWFEKNCSIEGSFNKTMEIINE